MNGGETADWYAAGSGGSPLSGGTGTLSHTPSGAGTYYAQARNSTSGCVSTTRTGVTLTITPLPTATISYAGPFCTSLASPQSVILSGTGGYTGGTYGAVPTGLTLNTGTGAITPSSSTPGTYTVTYNTPVAGGCASVQATTSVTITLLPTATISYAGNPFCTSISTPQPVTLIGTGAYTGGTYSPVTGLTINTSTGAITPSSSTPGTYTVTYNTLAGGGCSAVPATTTVTITGTGTWLGTTSTDWNTDANWCGGVKPTVTADVIIPSSAVVTNQPTIGADAVCHSITINSGATLTVSGNFNLTVGNSNAGSNWSNSGTFNAGTGTVIFNGTGTIGGSSTTSFNDVTTTGSANITTAAASTISGDLSIGNGTTFSAAAYNLTVTGTTTVGSGLSGTLAITSTTGTKIFTGLVTINSGGTWNNSINESVEFRGGITNSGTFTAGTGVYSFTTNAQALTGTLSIPSVTISGPTTNNGTLTVSTTLAGASTLINTGTLNFTGSTTIAPTLTASAAGNTVNYNGAAQTVDVTTYYNLILSTSGAKTVTGLTAVNGDLSTKWHCYSYSSFRIIHWR